MADINVEEVLKKLTPYEKIDLLAGKSASPGPFPVLLLLVVVFVLLLSLRRVMPGTLPIPVRPSDLPA